MAVPHLGWASHKKEKKNKRKNDNMSLCHMFFFFFLVGRAGKLNVFANILKMCHKFGSVLLSATLVTPPLAFSLFTSYFYVTL